MEKAKLRRQTTNDSKQLIVENIHRPQYLLRQTLYSRTPHLGVFNSRFKKRVLEEAVELF